MLETIEKRFSTSLPIGHKSENVETRRQTNTNNRLKFSVETCSVSKTVLHCRNKFFPVPGWPRALVLGFPVLSKCCSIRRNIKAARQSEQQSIHLENDTCIIASTSTGGSLRMAATFCANTPLARTASTIRRWLH